MSYSTVIKETNEHIEQINILIDKFSMLLKNRGNIHDQSKLTSPEIEYFESVSSKTLDLKYGTPEYNEALKELEPALLNHYAKNRHHPQHHLNGINDMNLLDIIEMFLDWNVSCNRYKEGNILKSIEINSERFNIDNQLKQIFQNTASLFDNLN